MTALDNTYSALISWKPIGGLIACLIALLECPRNLNKTTHRDLLLHQFLILKLPEYLYFKRRFIEQ